MAPSQRVLVLVPVPVPVLVLVLVPKPVMVWAATLRFVCVLLHPHLPPVLTTPRCVRLWLCVAVFLQRQRSPDMRVDDVLQRVVARLRGWATASPDSTPGVRHDAQASVRSTAAMALCWQPEPKVCAVAAARLCGLWLGRV